MANIKYEDSPIFDDNRVWRMPGSKVQALKSRMNLSPLKQDPQFRRQCGL